MSTTLYTKDVDAAEVVDDLTLHVKTKGVAPSPPDDITRLFVVPSEMGMDAGDEEFDAGGEALDAGPSKFVSWRPEGDVVPRAYEDHRPGAPS